MKPAPFEYVRPASLAEACELLAANGDARLIAGGQTLVPMLAMRLARPSMLIDIARLEELRGIRAEDGAIVVGAVTRQAVAERDPLVAREVPLLAKALPWVGHPPTRARGTVGGSIANADPSAEIALVAATLGAEVVVRTGADTETISATEFFIGPMITQVPPDGCVTAVRFPRRPAGRVGTGFGEISVRRSDFALVSAAAQVVLEADGRCAECFVAVGGAADIPLRLEGASALAGTRLADSDIAEAIADDIAGLDTMSDLHASGAYRRRVARTLAMRAVAEAREEASRVH
ncbi:FAD binding domain-containing protein [Propylenella binzhouense]|uniref:Xanthine dehydrogenase family protein subunit M n=1 Tax=Propylenella binzhouense TaxID=2555902 RepID=A0A964T2P6_9HYPH|nr:xanthine dehydrogenase family protein subunit M [Propylenella binzhouense]MYZ47265.1 xanthine dehydrogenase family protein subunit M [Propylenella binzhouense]